MRWSAAAASPTPRLATVSSVCSDDWGYSTATLRGEQDTQQASASHLAATGERAGRKVRTLVGLPPDGGRCKRPAKCAESAYYNLHAGVRIAGLDAGGRERLLRYVLRPPVVLSRLSMREDGALVLRLKRAWRNDYASYCTPLVPSHPGWAAAGLNLWFLAGNPAEAS